MLTSRDVTYAAPVVEQAINQIVQLTPLESVNEKIHEITQLLHDHLQQFLTVFGITLDTVKVLIFPKDERMRQLISLKAFGLSELDAVRYYAAILMAERGVVSAPNMAMGVPFNIGGIPQVQVPLDPVSGAVVPKPRAAQPPAAGFSGSPTQPPDVGLGE